MGDIPTDQDSKEFHERGKRHKENVEVKIAELRKKGQKQYETNQKLDGYLKQMEEDALKAFKKDVESNPDLMPEYKVALVEHRVKQQEGSIERTRTQENVIKVLAKLRRQTDLRTLCDLLDIKPDERSEEIDYNDVWSGSTHDGKAGEKTDSDSDEDSEDGEDAKSKSRGTKRTTDHAYGGWSSVSTGPEE
eukprot:XP_011681596.1 PREDICTED: uncharacterized protein LOC100888826 [Strongylocentrotus purpuratus]